MALLDIVIPTKNRQTTLVPVVGAMLSSLHGSDYRIVIHDNSDRELDEAIRDDWRTQGNIAYYHEAESIDVIENFNRAIGKVDARYATLIGDDDFVIPEIFNAIHKMDTLNLECMIHHRPVYYWPGMTFDREFDFFCPSSLLINSEVGEGVELFEPKQELTRVCASGGIYLFNLPALYHALVRSDALHELRAKFGDYVMGPSPDMSLAVALCAIEVRYGRSSIPFSVAGASYNSAAGMGRRGDHTASLDKTPSWLPKTMKSSWDPRLPEVWNGYSVYAQSILAVAKRTGLKVDLDFPALFRKMIAEDMGDVRYVRPKLARWHPFRNLKTIGAGLAEGMARRGVAYLPAFLLNRFIRMRPHFRSLDLYKGIETPQACIARAEAHIRERIPARQGG